MQPVWREPPAAVDAEAAMLMVLEAIWQTADEAEMARQYSAPLLVSSDDERAVALKQVDGTAEVTEALIQKLVHEHPEILPIREIDAAFTEAVPVCREMVTPAGQIDNFLLTPDGFPVIVECKLWRNPQARREVVGQILDYAKELSRWTSADIEREAAKRGVTSLFDHVRGARTDIDEAAFHDALSANLKRGRCLLLIVGDGIQKGVEAIFEHLREHAILQFSFGLVELSVFMLPDGGRLVTPRLLARTEVDVRRVVELPQGMGLVGSGAADSPEVDPDTQSLGDDRQRFWSEFLAGLEIDDPEQPIPRAPRAGNCSFSLPGGTKAPWITVYRDIRAGDVGLFLSFERGTAGERVCAAILEKWDEIRPALGGSASVISRGERRHLADSIHVGDWENREAREKAFAWLRTRTNDFINVLRPEVRAEMADEEIVDD